MEESFKLRAWTRADIPTLAKHLNNKKIWDNCRDALPYLYTEKDAEQFISFVEGQSEQNNYCIEINTGDPSLSSLYHSALYMIPPYRQQAVSAICACTRSHPAAVLQGVSARTALYCLLSS